MNKLTKGLLSLLSLLGILQVLWFIALIYPLGIFRQFAKLTFLPTVWVQNIGLGLGVLVGLTFLYLLLLAIFSPSRHHQLAIKTDQGELAFSRKAIDHTIAQAIVEHHAVTGVNVDTQLLGHKQQVKAQIEATATDNQHLDELGVAIKTTVKTVLTQTFNLPIKQIDVQLDSPVATKQRPTAKKPRVI